MLRLIAPERWRRNYRFIYQRCSGHRKGPKSPGFVCPKPTCWTQCRPLLRVRTSGYRWWSSTRWKGLSHRTPWRNEWRRGRVARFWISSLVGTRDGGGRGPCLWEGLALAGRDRSWTWSLGKASLGFLGLSISWGWWSAVWGTGALWFASWCTQRTGSSSASGSCVPSHA